MTRSSIVVAVLLPLAWSRAQAQDLVLTNARIVDPATRTISLEALWIRDGRIAGRGTAVPEAARGERVDLGARWVIPGLNDLHTHSFGNQAPGNVFDGGGSEATAGRVLRAGVTSFLDLFNAEEYIFGLRRRQRAGEIGGAEIFAAGPCFTATRGHCSEYGVPTRIIDTPEDARRQMAELAPKRPDVVKVVYAHVDYGPTSMPSIDRATLDALIASARRHGLKTVVHVGTWEDARHAVSAGAAAITHVPRDAPPPDLGPLMKERGVFHIPTLAVHLDLSELLMHPELLDAPLLVALTSDSMRAAYRRGEAALNPRQRARVARQVASRAATLQAVKQLHQAGVTMLTGTDAGNPGVIQGYSVHRELLRLVEAGLTPWEALAASTTNAARFLGRKFGVGVGDDANLVVLDASPVEDVANTQRIALVVSRGRIVYRR